MGRTLTVSDSVVIDADAETIWSQVADPGQTLRWSPENIGASSGEGRPLHVGEVFDGTNRRGRATWVTECVVKESEPGRRFVFDVRRIGLRAPTLRGRIARWAYDLEPVDGGTRVTETWTDGRTSWPDWLANAFDRAATGGSTFADFQRRNIRRTLDRMKTELDKPGG